ncbi:hypothetical protein AXK57_21830 [Tsukamurella pulmonis]|uniref:hypothetical protein n=1 Tax=Tsukamurella pulmonis TaxID=47312 RepID=UPI00079B310B|nr:hypothetical protein [Tsukamurella pulmonis]KXP11585.1 hypothetical protein AXK57_21830 [Tsukamurella pulmonis]
MVGLIVFGAAMVAFSGWRITEERKKRSDMSIADFAATVWAAGLLMVIGLLAIGVGAGLEGRAVMIAATILLAILGLVALWRAVAVVREWREARARNHALGIEGAGGISSRAIAAAAFGLGVVVWVVTFAVTMLWEPVTGSAPTHDTVDRLTLTGLFIGCGVMAVGWSYAWLLRPMIATIRQGIEDTRRQGRK